MRTKFLSKPRIHRRSAGMSGSHATTLEGEAATASSPGQAQASSPTKPTLPTGPEQSRGALQRGARAKGKERECWLHRRAGWTHRHLQRPEGAGTDPPWILNLVEATGPFGSSTPQGTSGKPRGEKGGALGSGWLGMQPAPLFISCVTWVGQGTSLGLSFSQPSEDRYLTSSVFLSLPLSPPQTSPCPPSSTPLHPLPSRQPATS